MENQKRSQHGRKVSWAAAKTYAAVSLQRFLRSIMAKSKSGYSLVIGNVQKYEDRLNFTVTNVGLPEVVVNRLYLHLSRYVRCPHCRSGHCMAMSVMEALMLSTEYELPLNGNYSQYNLIPLTPDNARNTFIYKDGDSDFFGIDFDFYGGTAYCVKICADYYDTRSQTERHIETDEIVFFKVAGGGNACTGRSTLHEWIKSPGRIPPEEGYCGQLKPIIYKIILTRLDQLTEFLAKFDKRILLACEPDLLRLLDSEDYMARGKAIATLGFLGRSEYVSYLIPFLRDTRCKEIVADALGSIGDSRATNALLDCLSGYVNNDMHYYGYDFQERVLMALGKVANADSVSIIQDYLGKLESHRSSRLEKSANATISVLLKKNQGVGDAKMISVLFLSADPTNASRLRLGEEFREINEQLRLAKQRDHFKLELPQLSLRPKDISGALLNAQPQIVHFSGHGTTEGALCFENETGQAHLVRPDALAALFEQFAGQVNCVLLNACYSETQAKAIAEYVNYVIGMNKAVGDKAAIAFAIGFYQALGAGRTIVDAYKLGCVQIRLQGISEHLTPVLIKKGETQL